MLNFETNLYFRIAWSIVSPLLMLTIFIYHVVLFQPVTYNGQEYPAHVQGNKIQNITFFDLLITIPFNVVIGWCIFVCGIIQLPFWMLVTLIQQWRIGNTLKVSHKTNKESVIEMTIRLSMKLYGYKTRYVFYVILKSVRFFRIF